MMTSLNQKTIDLGQQPQIQQEVSLTSSLKDARIQLMMNHSKQYLDQTFPLTNGSHDDVRSYVVYYQHLLAFMKDGTQTGLANPQQYIGSTGFKENPSSISLRNEEGHEIEIMFDAQGERGQHDAANIDHIQVK